MHYPRTSLHSARPYLGKDVILTQTVLLYSLVAWNHSVVTLCLLCVLKPLKPHWLLRGLLFFWWVPRETKRYHEMVCLLDLCAAISNMLIWWIQSIGMYLQFLSVFRFDCFNRSRAGPEVLPMPSKLWLWLLLPGKRLRRLWRQAWHSESRFSEEPIQNYSKPFYSKVCQDSDACERTQLKYIKKRIGKDA